MKTTAAVEETTARPDQPCTHHTPARSQIIAEFQIPLKFNFLKRKNRVSSSFTVEEKNQQQLPVKLQDAGEPARTPEQTVTSRT